MTARNWAAAFTFQWTPVLTFTRRRLKLLDWIDSNLDPVAFFEEPDRIGIAVLTPDLRLEVDRFKMTAFHSAEAGAEISGLGDLITGVLDVLAPKNVSLSTASSVWSEPLDVDDYNEARARFAQRIGLEPTGSEFRAFDASGLLDVESNNWRGQVEYGVVEGEELLFRLRQPQVGRIQGSSERWDTPVRLPELEEMDTTSVLIDVFLNRRHGGTVSGSEDVMTTIESATGESRQLVQAMMRKFEADGGSGSELVQAQ